MAAALFYSYSHRDEDLRAELEKHLSLLRRSGHITEWHDRRLEPGTEWKGEIDSHLLQAQVILLLISSDFLASDYCYDIEMKMALERHERGEAVVIPIILRPVDWMAAPFARLQGLPKDAKPVTTWSNRDEAFLDIARGLREVVTRRFASGPAPVSTAPPPLPPEREQERVLDAAMPNQVTVGEPAELLALIRRSSSGGLRAILHVEEEPGIAPEDVRSQPFHLEFPVGMSGALGPVTIALRIESPQFEPKSQAKELRVPPAGDSEVCRFLIVPQTAGRLTVMLEAVVAGVYQTSRLLRTDAGAQPVAQPSRMVVVSMPLFTASTVLRPAAPPPAPRPSIQDKVTGARPPRTQIDYEVGAPTSPPPAPAARPHDTAEYPVASPPSPQASKAGLSWMAKATGVAAALFGVAILVQTQFNRVTGGSHETLPPVTAAPAENAELRVTVVDRAGRPVTGVTVKHGDVEGVTDEAGRVALRTRVPPGGRAELILRAPGRKERRVQALAKENNRFTLEP